MNDERSKLEYELTVVEKKLDKEKRKRNIIMIVLCSVLCGFFNDNDNFDTILDVVGLIVGSVFLGSILYIVAILTFAAVTDLFTSITYLQSRKNHLEEKLNINDDEY